MARGGGYRGGGFPGGGGMGNIQQLMRQAQKMQQDMERVQEELEQKTVTASVGGGMITVVATGKRQLESITINPDAVDPDDVEMLQDMVLAAVNEALRQAEEMASSEMAKVTGGANIPGL